MQQRDPIRRQQRLKPGEERVVMIDSDMFEHADRNDSVITPEFLAVITQVESDAIRKPRRRGAARRRGALLGRECQTSHVGAAFGREEERETAPARADVEHPLSGADQQLGRNMSLLMELGGVEVVAAIIEVGTGILTVLVEEQFV